MTTSRRGVPSHPSIDLQELREQEVLRANRELAAYFKGRRTEREARAALKIIKAFIRDRERADPKVRRPLPGAGSGVAAGAKKRRSPTHRKPAGPRIVRRRGEDKLPEQPP